MAFLFLGVLAFTSAFGGAVYFAYNDGLRCLMIQDDLKCAKDEKCHWVMPSASENMTEGQCVPRRGFKLQDGQAVRISTGCAIVEGERACADYEPMDCNWNIPYKRCVHHPCALLLEDAKCAENAECEWKTDTKTCRKKTTS